MSTCLDHGIDYPHSAVHCPACWDMQTNGLILHEMRRANDLREQELRLRDEYLDSGMSRPEWTPTMCPVRYVQAPPKQQPKRGGMNIEPEQR